MIKRTVHIGSEEFKKAVLEVIAQEKPIINDIKNPRFERLYDGWIKDKDLNIEWGPSSVSSMNYSDAESHCKNIGGRLPTLEELESIIDRTTYSPACDKEVFKDMKNEWYWSSDKLADKSYTARWVVGFSSGSVNWGYECSSNVVRPVRPCQCG